MKEWLKEIAQKAAVEIGAELKQMGPHGAHEMAATLFNGSAFVMYPRGHHDDPQHGLPDVAQQQQGMEM